MSREASSKYDKPDIRGSPEDKKALVSLILETMQSKVPKHLRLQIKDLSTTVSALGYLHPAKRYTNMYGNLNAVFSKEDFSSIVTVDSTVLVLQPIEVLRASHSAGLISDADLALCESMWKYKEEFDAETRKNVRNDVFSFRNQDSQR